jgi:negative regulator of sigma E activity
MLGTPATFTLDQGKQGQFEMTVVDAHGRRCLLGDDGRYSWYRTGSKTVRTAAGSNALPLPVKANSKILGIGTQAGRRVVRLLVQNGDVAKEISIDRNTGALLAMTTRERRRVVSRMQFHHIVYQKDVPIGVCTKSAGLTTIHTATQAEVAQLLKAQPVVPTWLPESMKSQGMYREQCQCCRQEMAVLRYSDGLRSLTLFELPGEHTCMMTQGCQMAPAQDDLLDSRRIGNISIITVSDLDRVTLQHVLATLRTQQ